MAELNITVAAARDLERLIDQLALPSNTHERVRRKFSVLRDFPNAGRPLAGQWENRRLLLGPWSWMTIVYEYDHARDLVSVLMIQDVRAGDAVPSGTQ